MVYQYLLEEERRRRRAALGLPPDDPSDTTQPSELITFLQERLGPIAMPTGTEEKPPVPIEERYRQFLEARGPSTVAPRGVSLSEALGNLGRATPATIAEFLPGETGREFRELRSQVGPIEAFRRPVEEGGVRFPSVKMPESLKLGIVTALRTRGIPDVIGQKIADAITPEQLGLKGALETFAQPDVLLPAARPIGRLGAKGMEKAAPAVRRLATEQAGAVGKVPRRRLSERQVTAAITTPVASEALSPAAKAAQATEGVAKARADWLATPNGQHYQELRAIPYGVRQPRETVELRRLEKELTEQGMSRQERAAFRREIAEDEAFEARELAAQERADLAVETAEAAEIPVASRVTAGQPEMGVGARRMPQAAEAAATGWETGASRPFKFDPNSTVNQGRFRLLPPVKGGAYITRQSGTPGVSYIVDTEQNAIQAVRFDKKLMPEAKAAEWWEANAARLGQEAPVGARGRPVSESAEQTAQRPGAAPTDVEAAAQGLPPPAAAAPPRRPPGEPPIEPPVGPLEPPPVPPQGAQGRSLLGDLQDVEELVGIMMRPDIKRRIANLPGIRQLQATFNPAAVAQTPVDKGIVARAALREEGKNKAIGAFSTLEALGRRDKVWGALDDQGRLISGRLKGKSLDEVLTYRKKYDASFTPEQRAWTEQFHAIEESKRALLERAGIEINELSFEEGGEYVGRRVMGRLNQQTGEIVETAYIGAGPGRPGAKVSFEKARVYRDINDALSDGFRYLQPDEALFLNLRAAYNRVGDHMATEWILRQVPWRTTEVFSLPKASALVRQAMKKETIPASRLVALQRDMPEIAQRIEAAQAIEDWPTRYSTLQGIKEDLRKIIPETEAKLFWAVERIARDRKNAQAGIAAILRALRGETLPTGTVRAIERVLPDLKGLREQTRVTLKELIRAGEEAATYPRMLEVPKPGLVKRYQTMLAEAEAALAANPGNAALGKEVRRLRARIGFTKYRLGLGEPLEFAKSPTTILTGQRREALEETLTLLRGEAYEARTATGQATVKFRGGRVAELRKQELEARKMRQEVAERARTARYGEGTVAAPAFQGKILIGPEAKANAEALNRAFTAQYGKLDEILDAVNKVNAVGRYFMLAGDASTLMIQLIAFPSRFPHKMPKIILEATKAMFSPEAQAAYLAANNATVRSSRNLILSKGGQTEYTEAFRTVGWVTAKYSPGRLLVPFQRFFEASLDTAGVELRKSFAHLADTPENAADVEQFINEVRGVTSSARLGVSGSIQRGETTLFLAPRYNRAFAAWAADVLGGGIRGDQARKSLAALIAGWTAIGVAISLAQGEGWEGALRHITPGDPDFMTWTVFGQRVGPGSKIRSALMLLGRIMWEPERTVDFVNQFVRANLAPVPGKSLDILLGRNFIGEPTRPSRGVGWGEGMLGLARTLSEGMIPIWSQSVAMEGGDVMGRAVRGGAEFFGGRAYPATLYMEFSGRWRKELKPYFDIPTNLEPAAKTIYSQFSSQPTNARLAYRKNHPEIDAKLFLIGAVDSLVNTAPWGAAFQATVRLMRENNIRVEDIKGLEIKKYSNGKVIPNKLRDALILATEGAPTQQQKPKPVGTPSTPNQPTASSTSTSNTEAIRAYQDAAREAQEYLDSLRQPTPTPVGTR